MSNEFNIIKDYFQGWNYAPITLGVGDDAAIVRVPADHELVVTTDTLVADVHFPKETAAADIAYKALAVNLSDLAAMGAKPCWFSLALTLPDNDPSWLQAFSSGMRELAEEFALSLIGGDLTRGPLTLSITAQGIVPCGQAMLRSGAQVGDKLYVSGDLGGAGLALQRWQQGQTLCPLLAQRLHRPYPCVDQGLGLRSIATSAIDISDGLAADLHHLLQASGVGACIEAARLPICEPLLELPAQQALDLALSAGDDYQLCFTVPPALAVNLPEPCTCIGVIEAQPGLRLLNAAGERHRLAATGYQHFTETRDGNA